LRALDLVGVIDVDGFPGVEEVQRVRREQRKRLIGIICRGFARCFAAGRVLPPFRQSRA
jgi:hypothetical protein